MLMAEDLDIVVYVILRAYRMTLIVCQSFLRMKKIEFF